MLTNNHKNPAFKNKKVKKETNYNFLKSKFAEFCKRTDLHGFKYIVMEELNSVERFVEIYLLRIS